jgi:anti-sigma factor RsiW
MDCSGFENILADFQEGKLSPDEQSAAARHLERCPHCRQLMEIIDGSLNILPSDAQDELTRSILECTSGSVCPGIEPDLWDFVGGGLNEERSQLIALHLDHCSDCSAVAAELEELQDVLPTMAEIQPDGSFVREVVLLTDGLRSNRKKLAARFLTWWNAIVRRPSFSMEAAYVGTLAVVLLFSVPFLPFRNFGAETVPAIVQPATSRLVAISGSAKAPVTDGLKTIESTAALRGQAVSKFLSALGQDCARASVSIAGASFQGFRKWQQKEASAFVSIWTHWSSRIPRGRL